MPRPRQNRTAAGKSVEALRHEQDTRTNIPTAEYQSLVREEQEAPLRAAYQRRNRDLDPQLVWRGKDEQDLDELVVNVPPLYIQGEGASQGPHCRPGAPVEGESGTGGAADRYVRRLQRIA